MADPYNILHNLDPRLLQHLREQGLGPLQIMEQTGLLGALSRAELEEALKKKPEVVDRMRSPEVKRELHEAVVDKLNASAAELQQTTGIDELKARMRDIASAAARELKESGNQLR
jgi:hypothetical protein